MQPQTVPRHRTCARCSSGLSDDGSMGHGRTEHPDVQVAATAPCRRRPAPGTLSCGGSGERRYAHHLCLQWKRRDHLRLFPRVGQHHRLNRKCRGGTNYPAVSRNCCTERCHRSATTIVFGAPVRADLASARRDRSKLVSGMRGEQFGVCLDFSNRENRDRLVSAISYLVPSEHGLSAELGTRLSTDRLSTRILCRFSRRDLDALQAGPRTELVKASESNEC